MSSLAAGILLGLLLLWLLLRQEKRAVAPKPVPAAAPAALAPPVLLPDPQLLLVLLADRDIHPSPVQIERFRKLMSRAEGMEATRLSNVIASVFASSPDEEDRVRSGVEAWQATATPVADPGQEPTRLGAPQTAWAGPPLHAKARGGRAWVVGLGVVLGALLVAGLAWWDTAPPPDNEHRLTTVETEGGRNELSPGPQDPDPGPPPAAPQEAQPRSRKLYLPTFERTPAAPGYLARGLLIAGGILLVASVALLVVAIYRLVGQKEKKEEDNAAPQLAAPVDQGRFWLRRLPPGPLVDPREGPRLALAMPLIDGDEVSRLLDMKRSIRDTLRAGIPTLSFRPRRVVPELWLVEDRKAESYLCSRAVSELERVLAEQGVPVRRFLMRGRYVGGLSVPRWVASAGSARLLVVSDGASLVGDERSLSALAAAEAGIWRVGSPQVGLEGWVSRGLRLVDRDGLRGFLSGQRGVHQRALWPTAMQAWAAACALSPLPVLPEDALGLRAALELPVPVEAVDVLMARSIRRDVLQFSPEEQRELWAWATDVAPELRRRALVWWERRLRAEPAAGAEAHREGLLATLKLWESPEEGLDQLVKLQQHPLFPELRGRLEALLEGGPAGLEEKGKETLKVLGLRAPEPVADVAPPKGWGDFWAPLVTGALAIFCVGLGTWRIFQEDARPVVLAGGEVELLPGQREVELGAGPVEGRLKGWPWRAEPEGAMVWVQVWAAGRWQRAELLRAGDRLALATEGDKITMATGAIPCDVGEIHACGHCPMDGDRAAVAGKVAVLAGDGGNGDLADFGRRLVDHGLVDAWVAAVKTDDLPALPQFATVLGVGIAAEQVRALRGGGDGQRDCVLSPARNASVQAGDAIDWRRNSEMLVQGEGKELVDVFATEGAGCGGWVIQQSTCTVGLSRLDMVVDPPRVEAGATGEHLIPDTALGRAGAGRPPSKPGIGTGSGGSGPVQQTAPEKPMQEQTPGQAPETKPAAPVVKRASIRIDTMDAGSPAASLSCMEEVQTLRLGPSTTVDVPAVGSCFLRLDGAGVGDGATLKPGGSYLCSVQGGRLQCDVQGTEISPDGFVPIRPTNLSMNPATLRLAMDYNRYSGLLTCGDTRRELQLIGGVEERIEGDALQSCVLAVQGLSGLATLQFGKTYLCSGANGLLRCEERGAGVLERVQQRQEARRTGDLRVDVKGALADDVGWVDCGGNREPEGNLRRGGTFADIWAEEDCSFSIDGVEGSFPVRGGFRYDCAVLTSTSRDGNTGMELRRLQCDKAGVFGSAP